MLVKMQCQGGWKNDIFNENFGFSAENVTKNVDLIINNKLLTLKNC